MLNSENVVRWVSENFFHRHQHVRSSAGAADAGRPVVLDSTGKLDATLIDTTDVLGGAWTAMTLASGWANFGFGYGNAAYRKSGDTVFIRGMVNRASGTNTLIATLPTGYRPPAILNATTTSNETLARIEIYTDGTIVYAIGPAANNWVDLHIPPFSTT